MTESDAVVRVSVARLAVVTVSLPLGAFFLCIYLSLRFNFDLSTATHCGVPNYLPSISSAIGEFVPQRYIWRAAIAVHCAPRFLVASMYYSFMNRILPNVAFYRNAVKVTTLLNVVENVALLSLSFVSSKENYDVHKVSFILFMVCSELYMVLTCLLLKDNARRFTTPLERLAFVKKKQLMTANLASFVIALYFFYRHNKYCEPGMYSVFAFMEYIVVLTNMAFHMTAYYDFHNHDLVVCEWKTASS
ncbi:post-GPI attachment to proteins factor 2-like isoform X2 [Homarus americanus]|uniref:Post-GPI attachment to proteins factor 2-like 1 n=2 Tax=Homarus americanus TaxID=6706 RepID=A0A8J5MQ15_HOMAM|nr:post-GPI attachment to proteins factor 2-like isoform X2 [Homarus americanus]KAG7159563.1 Post-GPI attachment to proteins factor 2-like 1 [Homarus americanus]